MAGGIFDRRDKPGCTDYVRQIPVGVFEVLAMDTVLPSALLLLTQLQNAAAECMPHHGLMILFRRDVRQVPDRR